MDEVFDLASGDYDSEKFDIFTKKTRKDYVVQKPTGGKIKVTFTTEDDHNYSCIYFYKSNQEVYDMIKEGRSLNLRFTYIKDFNFEFVNLYKYKLTNFNASMSFWDGRACFISANFWEGDVNFSGAQFGDGDVDFSLANFGDGNVDFLGANFGNGVASFIFAQFGDGYVSFLGANFGNGYVDFGNTNFGDGNVDFVGANFGNGVVSFGNANFGDSNVDFSLANFGDGVVSFYEANFGDGVVSFYEANFGDGNVDFWEANFGDGNVDFLGANFGGGNVDFSHANFGDGNVDFRGSSVKSIKFYRSTFASHVDLRFDKIVELIVEDCIIEKTIKCQSPTKYKKLSFLHTVNLGQIYLNWNDDGVFCAISNGKKISKDSKDDIPFTSEEKASQFRMLKENFHNIGYYDDEDKAYRAYMKFKTNNIKRYWMKIFGLIGGYGTQAWKVILAALAVIAAFGGIFTAPMQLAEKLPNDIEFSCEFFKGLYFSAITFLTIGYGDISPPNQTIALLAGIEGFLGLFLMSYFTVCVVRKLLR